MKAHLIRLGYPKGIRYVVQEFNGILAPWVTPSSSGSVSEKSEHTGSYSSCDHMISYMHDTIQESWSTSAYGASTAIVASCHMVMDSPACRGWQAVKPQLLGSP